MNYWVFITTQKKTDGGVIEGSQILQQRLGDKFWGLGERTPNRRYLQKGDQVVFYVGLPTMAFVATVTLASDSFALSKEQRQQYSHGKPVYEAEYGVMLENIRIWDSPRPVKDLVPFLKLIENKEYWHAYFQGGIRQLPEDDYRVVVDGVRPTSNASSTTDATIVSPSQFALEAHLEDFIDKNWNRINFGADLVRYEIDDQSGRQFPAGPWNVDFLCLDKSNGDFVVIELKRGKTSDSTVGQVLRYIGWVDQNLAKPHQKTRGIIITQDVDDALRYATKGLKNVRVLTYKVDFKLMPFEE